MSSEFQSFDEYWSLFLFRSRPVARGHASLARTSLGLARVALTTLAARRGARRVRTPAELRWAVAATLLSWGKLLAGTLDEELAEAARADAKKWPPRTAIAALDGDTTEREDSARPRASAFSHPWAVWM